MRLGRLVEEERPGVGGRLGDLRLDDASRRAPRAARRTRRPRRSAGAPDRRPTAAASASRCAARRGAAPARGAPREDRPHQRDVLRPSAPSGRPCRTSGRADTRRRRGCGPSSASGRRRRSTTRAAGSSSPCRCRDRARTCPAASAAALPPEEPPVVRPGSRGFWTVPYHGFWLVTPHANSCRFAFAVTTAPAATSRCTAVAVVVGTWSA